MNETNLKDNLFSLDKIAVISLPSLYWLSKLSSHFSGLNLIIALTYSTLIVINLLTRDYLLYKSKSKFTTADFSHFFVQHRSLVVIAFVHVLFSLFSFALMILDEKTEFVWLLIFSYGFGMVYQIISFRFMPRYKTKIEQIETYMRKEVLKKKM